MEENWVIYLELRVLFNFLTVNTRFFYDLLFRGGGSHLRDKEKGVTVVGIFESDSLGKGLLNIGVIGASTVVRWNKTFSIITEVDAHTKRSSKMFRSVLQETILKNNNTTSLFSEISTDYGSIQDIVRLGIIVREGEGLTIIVIVFILIGNFKGIVTKNLVVDS